MTRRAELNRRELLLRSLAVGGAGLLASQLPGEGFAAEPASPWRIGIYTRPWAEFDYRAALDEIAKAGFRHAGLMTTATADRRYVIDANSSAEEAETIGQEARQRGLEIPSVYGGPFPVNKSVEEGVAGLRRLIDNCVAAGARTLLLGGTGNPELFDRYFQVVQRCCDYAAEKKLPLTIKPHGGLNASGKQCRKCLESVGHANFSLWYDPGNIFFYSEGKLDPVDDAAEVDGLVREGMCIKDFDMTDKDGQMVRQVDLTPGDGRVNFPAVLKRLQQGGFTSGDLVIECVARGDGSLAAIQTEARRALQFVEQVVSG